MNHYERTLTADRHPPTQKIILRYFLHSIVPIWDVLEYVYQIEGKLQSVQHLAVHFTEQSMLIHIERDYHICTRLRQFSPVSGTIATDKHTSV